MTCILTADGLAKTYAVHTLFTGVTVGLAAGDCVGLIGPNGSGKSTLLRILAGMEAPDAGDITYRRGLRISYVPQSDHFADDDTPVSAVAGRLSQQDIRDQSDTETRIAITLSKLGFVDLYQSVGTLSGGWRKRLSIACALASNPDLLMLDEPTNHLDLEGVLWLEQFVKQVGMAVVVVTHDRTFLESVASRVIELSRVYPGGTFEVKGNYSQFVRRKNQFLDAQAAQQVALAGKVRRDQAWLRQGVQGRQTRNKSQVQAAGVRQTHLRAVKNRNAATRHTTAIDFQATGRKSKRLLAVHRLSKSMGGKLLFDRLDLILSPGLRLGLLGPNGSGKTTLLRLLAGELEPDQGTVKPAAELRIVNFTQHREALDPTQSLRAALCPISDSVLYRGKSMHVAAWAKKFLFEPSQFNTSVGDLSGGEQARILIAKLMLKPADVLILDEPTNDLDISSLEVLDQALMEFAGAVVLVTHDRFMLSRLCTELLALDGCGRAKRYVSYDQWSQTRGGHDGGKTVAARTAAGPVAEKRKSKPVTTTKKLSYKLQHEFDHMEQTILVAEADLATIERQAADPAAIGDSSRHAEICQELADAQARVQRLYDRWAQLEAMRQG